MFEAYSLDPSSGNILDLGHSAGPRNETAGNIHPHTPRNDLWAVSRRVAFLYCSQLILQATTLFYQESDPSPHQQEPGELFGRISP